MEPSQRAPGIGKRTAYLTDLMPALAHQFLQPFLSLLDPRRVVLRDDLRRVPKNCRDVLYRRAREKKLHRAGVAEPMRVPLSISASSKTLAR